MTGDAKNAATAAQHVASAEEPAARGRPGHAPVFGRGADARGEHRPRLSLEHGNHVEAMRLLARIGMARDVLDDAELLLEAVLTLAPDYRAARHDYALVLIERHKYQPGARAAREAVAARSRRIATTARSTRPPASASASTRRRFRSTASSSSMRRAAPDLHLSIAHALKTIGRRDEAIEAYRAAAAARPNFGDAYWSLANLKTYRFLDEEIARMRAAGGGARNAARRSLSPVFCARQGLRGSGRVRGVLALLRARQCAEARREPLPARDHREQHAAADRNLHARVLRRAGGVRRRRIPIRSSSSGCRARARRSSSRSSPRIRGSRARRNSPTFSASSSICRAGSSDLDNPRYPGVLAGLEARGFPPARREIPGTTRASIAPASRTSSTRCRTISGTSASST